MAITGIVLLGFVLGHMVGNLKLYFGAAGMNHYAEFLRELPGPLLPRSVLLWLIRGGLATAFILHIHAAYTLTQMNHRARPVEYAGGRDYVAANFASRTMRWTGIIVALYIVFHLADLTWGTTNNDYLRGDTYNNLVASFDRVPVSLVYIVANLALGVHIFHGAWSLFQSLGWNNPRFNDWRRRFAQGFAAVIVLANVSFPIAVMTGLVERDDDQRREVCEQTQQQDTEPCRAVGA
jgi:succinate dehydrogenase / fumarate reductase cytochrome b subunit